MADGQVVFEIKGDASNVNQTVKQVTSNIESESKKWDKSVGDSSDKMGKSFSAMKTAAVSAIAAIGAAVVKFGKEAIEAASDLREVQNVVDTVFGDGAKQIDNWSKKAVTQFGLSETMAKRFTSTLGAMMKSSGLAGDEIVDMSTDLAGLAADMASFYNLDFETAFEKIRSGISGQSMPLKQLGIDMSVANLNAFALAQGLEKTFTEMDQGEQTMLRYQYLMQATADAQGDFEKTSDGYANSLRMIESNFNSLLTSVGTPFLSAVEKATSTVNNLVSALIPKADEETYIDKVNQIEIDKEEKIREINEVAELARKLAEDMGSISSNRDVEQVVSNLARGANNLRADSKTNWESVLTSLTGINGLENIFGDNSTSVQNISDLATALSGNSPTTSQAQAWKDLLGALSTNKDAIANLTGQDAEGAAKWLETIADKVDDITPGDVAAWQELMNVLIGGIDTESKEGKAFVDSLIENFLSMGSGSEEAAAGLAALGLTTDDISEKQATWLEYCKELVRTIPGLSSLINTSTGEIKGGLPALADYVDQWEELAKYEAQVKAIEQERTTYESMTDPATLKAKTKVARSTAEAQLTLGGYSNFDTELDKVIKFINSAVDARMTWKDFKKDIIDVRDLITGDNSKNPGIKPRVRSAAELLGIDPEDLKWINGLVGDAEAAVLAYAEALFNETETERERPLVLDRLTQSEEDLANEMGITVEELRAQQQAAEEAAAEMTDLEKAMSGDTEAADRLASEWQNAGEALKAVSDYYKNVEDATRQAVNSTLKGFEEVKKAGDDIREQKKQVDSDLAAAEIKNNALLAQYGGVSGIAAMDDAAWEKLPDEVQAAYNEIANLRKEQDKLNESLNQYSPQGMIKGLQSQIDYIDEYIENLQWAEEAGLSAELLAQLSDGSKESAEYLAQLKGADSDTITTLNDKYTELQEKQAGFTKTLTDTRLAADDAYQALLDAASSALADLDMYDETKESMADTVQGIADGVAETLPSVHSAVQSVIDELNRLSAYGINYGFDAAGGVEIVFGDAQPMATGSDWIPYDGFPALLHRGEAVLTAEENKIWQTFKNGSRPAMDYETLGGVMQESIKPGGNVYLEGRIVGQVMSDVQGNQYRALQRSGWQK